MCGLCDLFYNAIQPIIQEGLTVIQYCQSRKNGGSSMVLLAFGSLLLISQALAQKTAPNPSANDANLDRCLHGLPTCDVNRLKPDDVSRIAESNRARNVQNCRSASSSCDPTSLAPEELKAVMSANARRNV